MKPKGQGVTDSFYIKAQSFVIKEYVNKGTKAIVTDWSKNGYFLTVDRASFYIIPKSKFCLTEKFYSPCKKLFLMEKDFLRDIYGSEFMEVSLTGNQTKNVFTGQTISEVSTPIGLKYISEEELSIFPKQRLYCMSKPDGPVFILTTLRVLLGGVWPLKTKKTESGYNKE